MLSVEERLRAKKELVGVGQGSKQSVRESEWGDGTDWEDGGSIEIFTNKLGGSEGVLDVISLCSPNCHRTNL